MKTHETEKCVRLVPIFNALPVSDIQDIAKLIVEHEFQAGETLFMERMPAKSLFIIARGQVKISKSTTGGRQQLLRILQPGDFDGEAVLFSSVEHQTTATALSRLKVCTISQQSFQQLLKSSADLALNVINALGQRLARLEVHDTTTSLETVSQRLAAYLINTSSALKTLSFDLPLAKKDLALYLGTTPETISRNLAKFKNSKLIKLSGKHHVEILNSTGLSLNYF